MKKRMRKNLSCPALLTEVGHQFAKIRDPLETQTKYSLKDCLMSGLAMFNLKFPSLLQFDQNKGTEKVRHNLQTLYQVAQAPSDTYMRERLDPVDPKRFNGAFKACFRALQRSKMLPLFHFNDEGYLLISNDGTGIFNSKSVRCDNCCEKHHRNGEISYYHQIMAAVMVHPDQSAAIPMTMEPILKQDGGHKNDCEQNASKRLLERLRRMHANLKMVIVEDALHANAPHIRLLKSLNYRYIIGVKPKEHQWLFDYVNTAEAQTSQIQRQGVTYTFRWVNGAPLNEANEALRVNFLECRETTPQGRSRVFTWITDFTITKNNVFQLMRGGRSRWKIENETFNTLKTQGYHFEHNYGHGHQNLSTVLANLMMLAFLIDQIQWLFCPMFEAALKNCKKRKYLREHIRNWFVTFFIESWEAFFQALAQPPDFSITTDTS